jgi:hypothetical protein
MKKLIVLILIVSSFVFCNIKINYGSFGDNATFITSYGINVAILYDGINYSINADRTESPTRQAGKYWAGADKDLTDKASLFAFLSNDNEVNRIGAGAGYELTDHILVFPFKNKVSLAVVNDQVRGTILSYRYKFDGYFAGVGAHMVWFILGRYTYTLDYKLTYAINSKVSLMYKGYYDDYSQINQSSFGIELII